MKSISASIKKAVIEMMLLNLLNQQDMYGYELTQTLKHQSNGRFTILEGSMYPILYRLTEEHHISSYEKKVGKRQVRVYYHIEKSGMELLQNMKDEYEDYIQLINELLSIKISDEGYKN